MKIKHKLGILSLSLCFNAFLYAEGSLSPYQSTDRPFGLDIVGEVYTAASDDDSIDFQNNYLPEIQQIVQNNLASGVALSTETVSSLALDSTKLDLAYDSDLRVYFVGEGAGYHNTLGFNTEGPGISDGNPQLIFPDASRRSGSTSENYPVNTGDFVELGTFSAGTSLDFFLIANGANGGSNVFSTDTDANGDGLQHVVSFAVQDSAYLFLGFEDIYGGGDRDYDDLLFAVDIGLANVQELIETSALVPEPEEFLLMIIVGLFCLKYFNNQNRLSKV
ncbi:DUF4114 domain-containing protein [Lentisphaera marina]|uniref:DUF4114 domain-containing protein n=1 Tax=Lentisphaera marina TaxID=1111041 RepID=UPI0023653A6C|nr:DUF4114 domain-containing protein [Lentisphaera marina]MDD7986129.1 DUF4114 domain-containing protein [Lentisphaera marina]